MSTRRPGAGDFRALGDALRRHRTAACLSQEQVAQKTGMSQKKYSRIEGGEIQDPGLADVVSIGKVFGLTPDSIAELAGLWARTRPRAVDDERWAAILTFMEESTLVQRNRFLDLSYGVLLGLWPRAEKITGSSAARIRSAVGADRQ